MPRLDLAEGVVPLKCPVCGVPVTGHRITCSSRCRQRKARAARAAALESVQDLLDRQTAALAAGADPVVLQCLAREARRLLARVNGR